MDRQRFEKIKIELCEKTVRNGKYRQKMKLLAKRGKPLPESYEECLTWIAKEKLQPCEDCSLITTNSLKTFSYQRDRQGTGRWYKRCDECGKKTLLHTKVKRKS